MSRRDTLIFIPTYNEADNIVPMVDRIRATGIAADITYMDDNSTDGTGAIIDRHAADSDDFFALHRAGKLGVGSAHSAGIAWAYTQGYRVLITMDADFSHSPEDIGGFLEQSRTYDIVVGTRFQKPNSLPVE